MRNKYILVCLAVAFVLPSHAQRQDVMKQTVEYLASQQLGGRFPATIGDTLASEFIVNELRGLKLKPIIKGKKDVAYFQDFTYGKTKEQALRYAVILMDIADQAQEDFDELIIEVRGSTVWIHFAVRPKGNRRRLLLDIRKK